MMKIVGRILIILLAALIVAGVTVGITRMTGSGAQPPPPSGGPLVMLLSSPFVRDVLPGQWDHLAGNRYIGTINNLEKIIIVAAIVIAINLGVDRIKRARRKHKSPHT